MLGRLPIRQAAVWPPVHSMQFPATLLGCGLAELGAYRASPEGYGFRDLLLEGLLSPFRPERIAQPGNSYTHRYPRILLDLVREQRSQGGQQGGNSKQTGRPARKDAGTKRSDAKQQATEQVRNPI